MSGLHANYSAIWARQKYCQRWRTEPSARGHWYLIYWSKEDNQYCYKKLIRFLEENNKTSILDILINSESYLRRTLFIWNFILKVLRFFNFGDNYIKWIKILFVVQGYVSFHMVFSHNVFQWNVDVDKGTQFPHIFFCYVRKLWESWLWIIPKLRE